MDIRNFFIGFLMVTVFFLIISGTQNTTSEIKTKSLQIVNNSGKVVVEIRSDASGGELIMYDNVGNIRIYSSSTGDGGVFSIANDKGKYVASIGVDVNKDGSFLLMDRYGDIGINLTGKR
jgi:hypothetical protein